MSETQDTQAAPDRRQHRTVWIFGSVAVLGALPLTIGIGQGASLRQPLGMTVMGGLILSQVFTLYTTPVIYLGLDRVRVKMREWTGGLVMAAKCER